MTTLDSLFTEADVVFTYTRQQAIADGELIDVSSTAREAGLKFPVAMSRAAWAEFVAWSDEDSTRQVYQDESGRLWDVLWMLVTAVRRDITQARTVSDRIDFEVYRVPRGGRATRPRSAALYALCHPGDDGEPVVTIMLPNEKD